MRHIVIHQSSCFLTFYGSGVNPQGYTMCHIVFHQSCGRQPASRHATKQARLVEHNAAHCVPPDRLLPYILRHGCQAARLVEHNVPQYVPPILQARTPPHHAKKQARLVEHNAAHCVPPSGLFPHVMGPGGQAAMLVEHNVPHYAPPILRARTRIAARE